MFNQKGQRNINQLKLGDRLLSKLKCGLGMLQRSSNLLTTKAKKLLYYGQVHSHLCYGLGGYGAQCFQLGKQKNCVFFNVNV